VLAVEREDVEGIDLKVGVTLLGMQRVEVGDAVDPEHFGLAVQHEPTNCARLTSLKFCLKIYRPR
jgi:hypothetical protein